MIISIQPILSMVPFLDQSKLHQNSDAKMELVFLVLTNVTLVKTLLMNVSFVLLVELIHQNVIVQMDNILTNLISVEIVMLNVKLVVISLFVLNVLKILSELLQKNVSV